MPHREPFDPKRPLVAARDFTFAGVRYSPGDPFPSPEAAPVASFPRRLVERQYNTMAVNHAAEASDEASDPIQMTGPKGGRYTITAPWLETPLTIRGKVNAEKALAEMREEGPPLGWIEGGSEVEIEEHGGGWYEITAPWLDEPEKVQGREAAERRQREIHEGRPQDDDEAQSDADGAVDGSNGAPGNLYKSEIDQGRAGEGSAIGDAEQGEGDNGAENGSDAA